MRLFALSIFLSLPCLICSSQFIVDGTVLELTDSNFDEAISSFDYIFVDFYAPWCGHCKRLSPELDKAAPVLAKLKKPILIAKVNADKYSRLATKYDIDGFPSLKIFMKGVPTNYYGSREADLLVRFLKKFVAPDVAILSSDTNIREFVEDAGFNIPIFIGYGLNESVITNMAVKYKKKAWFSVAKGFSEEVMVLHDFDKVPSLISLHPTYDERSVFYGPFEEPFLEDFVRQNMFPVVVPINGETLKQLKDDERKIVLTIMDDTKEEKSKRLTETLKAAASANRDFIFGYVGVKQYHEFAQSFEVTKNTKLPKMVVWDGNEVYFSVVGSESIDEDDERSQVSRFLEGYSEGNVTKKQISGPSFIMSNMSWVVGIAIVYIFGSAVLIIMLIKTIKKEDQALKDGTTREQADHLMRNTTNSEEEIRSNEIPSRSGEKED
ncbi:protein disulfide-isomerase 5-2-like [Impatiens glandulifera]|uniref:protein disulfide-isomerase 5-2-like n=1 Tax=Impatiens glandulifera TaxID=253017 RepID=UPI001FB0F2C3|nr:protein disulfide-isomerase 5-2-like [Impatiens glandulifera]